MGKKATQASFVKAKLKLEKDGAVIDNIAYAEKHNLKPSTVYNVLYNAVTFGAAVRTPDGDFKINSNAMALFLARKASTTRTKNHLQKKRRTKSIIAIDNLIADLEKAKTVIEKAESVLKATGTL